MFGFPIIQTQTDKSELIRLFFDLLECMKRDVLDELRKEAEEGAM